MTATVVEVYGLSKVFRLGSVESVALSDIDLKVAAAEFVALAGPSGSGKTTLLNLIGCLDHATRGQIWLAGQETTALSRRHRADFRARHVGFVFQSYNLIPTLGALENIELPLLNQGAAGPEQRRRARALLAAVGLGAKERHRPSELSGGEQQRVAVARALVTRPTVVLADEPTANLDSANGALVLDTMRRFNQDYGTTFLFATHDPLVMERADRVVRLHDGRIVPHGHRAGSQGPP